MQYIIDGYNLFFQFFHKPHLADQERIDFVSTLHRAMGEAGLKALLIFDSHPAHAHLYPSRLPSEHLEIIFSPLHVSADEYILEYISTSPLRRETILISSDRALGSHARALGASTLTISAFLQFLRKKTSRPLTLSDKPKREPSYQLERLLKIFEERFHQKCDE